MLIANNPVIVHSAPTSSHPIGMTLEQFCWFFSRVKDLRYSLSSFDASSSPPSLSVIDAADALAALVAATSNSGVFSSSGTVSRFLEDKESNVSVESPRWFDTSINIDLGKSVVYFGVYYPWIRISMANGVNSFSPRVICGNVRFLSGTIPLYADSSSFIGDGRLEVAQTYDELKLQAVQNRVARFSAPSGFSKYNKASIGGVRCSLSNQGGSILVTAPANAKNGHIRFSSNAPFDAFLSLDKATLA
jgi:hypothetical protein